MCFVKDRPGRERCRGGVCAAGREREERGAGGRHNNTGEEGPPMPPHAHRNRAECIERGGVQGGEKRGRLGKSWGRCGNQAPSFSPTCAVPS